MKEDSEMDKELKKKYINVVPQNDLHFQLLTTNTEWGGNIPDELRDKLSKKYLVENEQGERFIKTTGLWEILGFYTRDLRLGNLSEWNGELTYVRYYLDLANDLLQENAVKPFLICISRVATQIESSQSKGGFLRRRMNTLTQEHFQQEFEPKKKSLFGNLMGGGKNDNN